MKYLIAGFLFLSSCTTITFVRTQSFPTKEAVVRYPVQPNQSRENRYREKLNKEASAYCNGEFTIKKEYASLENTGTSTGFGTGSNGVLIGASSANTDMFNFVEFSCL